MGDAKKDPISCALSIMRRMPPNKIEHNLSGLLNLVPEHTDELLQRVDQPLEEATCAESGRKYLLCDYNRDGDSYRSPWSNAYEPLTPGVGGVFDDAQSSDAPPMLVQKASGTSVRGDADAATIEGH